LGIFFFYPNPEVKVPPLNMTQAMARDPVPLQWKWDNRDWSITLELLINV